MKRKIKKKVSTFLYEKLPHPIYLLIQEIWRFLRFEQYRRLLRIQKIFIKRYGLFVINGPFKNLSYLSDSVGSILLPKLIGSYEYVLHQKIKEIYKEIKPHKIIDIGVAEGYYLIGLGSKIPNADLIGYDIDKKALDLTQRLYKKNNLSNKLVLESLCSPKSLEHHITNNTLIICDAEGFENEILDPSKINALKKVDHILVETHDIYIPGTKERIKRRFTKTHTIEEIQFDIVPKNTYRFLSELNFKDYLAIANERKDKNQVWLWMTLKKNN